MADIQADLGLDTSEALDSVDSVGTALDQITSQFKAGLADAIGVLDDVSIEVDASSVTTEIDSAVAAADTSVDVEAGVTGTEDITAEIDSAVAGADATVTVDADTSQAEEAIAAVGDSAEGATASLGGFGDAAQGASEGASSAAGAVGGLTSSLLGGKAVVAGATGGVLAATAALGAFFESGVASKGAMERLNATLGPFAANVNNIQVGNLNTSLSELATQTGSSGAGMRQAAASAAQLQIAAGQGQKQAAEFSAQLLALSGRAVALNPNLGQTGDVAANMGKALARGGRFAASFGISLTTAEIKARAAQNAAKGLGDGVSQASLQMAGAQLATEKYGNSLKQNIAEGAKSPELSLRSLQVQLKSTIAEVSRPLVVPMLQILKDALPILQTFASILGHVFQAVLPAIEPVIKVIGDLVSQFEGPVVAAIEAVAPSFEQFGQAVAGILVALSPLIPVIATLATSMITSLQPILVLVADVLKAITPIVAVFAEALSAVLPIITALVNPFAAIGSLFSDDAEEASKLKSSTDALTAAFKTSGDIVDDAAHGYNGLTDAQKASTKAFNEYISAQSSFAKGNQLDDLARAKISYETLAKAIDGNKGAIQDYNEAIAAGLKNGKLSFQDAQLLIDKLGTETKAHQDAAQAAFEQAAATGELGDKQADAAIKANTAKDGTVNYSAALKDATAATDAAKAAAEAAAPAVVLQGAAFQSLAQQILAGQLAATDYDATAKSMGITLDELTSFAEQVTAALTEFTTTAASQLPTAATAFDVVKSAADEAKRAIDPEEFARKLQEQTFAVLSFKDSLGKLLAEGMTETVAFLASKGPELGGQLAKSLVDGTPATRAALEGQLTLAKNANGDLVQFYRTEAGPAIIGATTEVAQGATAGFAENIDWSDPAAVAAAAAAGTITAQEPAMAQAGAGLGAAGVAGYTGATNLAQPTAAEVRAAQLGYGAGQSTVAGAAARVGTSASDAYGSGLTLGNQSSVALDAASTIIQQNGLVKAVALSAGYQVGQSFTAGIKAGVASLSGEVALAAAEVVDKAERAARKAADSQSPSKLFAALGEDLAAGVAIGIADAATLPVAASTAMVSDIAGTVVGSPVGAVSSTVNGGDQVTIAVTVNAVPGMSESEAQQQGRTIGVAAARAWVSEVAAQ